MKRDQLLRRIRKAASKAGMDMTIREGGNHTIVRVGNVQTAIARHREIPENTARAVLRQLELAFGEGWWRQ